MQGLRPSWASTLRLPRSSFPPRASLAERQDYLKRCTDDLYAWQRSAPSSQQDFVLHDGPPYANGSLHIGHALNKILKDITCRVQLVRGRRVSYVPGWDCHGLPIELKALQKQREDGKSSNASELGAVVTRRIARDLAQATVEEQKAGFREWGVMADWAGAWRTMDKDFEARQLRVFKAMLQQELIFRKFKPVYWSPSSQTALAEAELEYNPEHRSTAAFVKFPLSKIPPCVLQFSNRDTVSVVIWTTTPWTLPANRAIAIHKDLEYSLVKTEKHGLLIVGSSRVAELGKRCEEDLSSAILASFKGSHCLSALYKHPLFGKEGSEYPMLHAGFVSEDSGTGLVHVAPGHGMDDYNLCLEHDIEPVAPVDETGRFTTDAFPSDPEVLAGKEVLKDGNATVLDMLSSKNALLGIQKYVHNYPYDWRSKQPVIIRATRQWFADVGKIRPQTLESLAEVRFVPEGGRERLSSFIRNRSEWCISRQRAWGVPIPALYREDSEEAIITPESVDHIIKVQEERGTDAWWTDSEFDPAWVLPSLRGRGRYRRGRDTMDVWFDSGTSWTRMSKSNDNPSQVADIYIEGTDQHRGWFQSSLLTKVAVQTVENAKPATAPFKTLITHGFILDQEGKKMSKSLGNVISPSEIMQGTLLPPLKKKSKKGGAKSEGPRFDEMGTDALRLWVAGCDFTRDVVVGLPVLKAVNTSLSKLRVSFKMLTGLLDTHRPENTISFNSLNKPDQMALLALKELEKTVTECYSLFEYHRGIAAINQFINTDFSANYIESIKDRMYADATYSPSRIEAQIVLWEIFQAMSGMLSPITPLLVEEACSHLPDQLQAFHPIRAFWGGNRTSSVKGAWESRWLEDNMPILNAINAAVKNAQEQARLQKMMGSSLQSFVVLQLQENNPLLQLEDQDLSAMLEDILVVSRVHIQRQRDTLPKLEGLWSYQTTFEAKGYYMEAVVHEPTAEKCVRCWKYSSVDREEIEEAVCRRCIGVVANGGEGAIETIVEGKPKLAVLAEAIVKGEKNSLSRHL